MPRIAKLRLPGAVLIEPQPRGDERGWFARYLDLDELREAVPGPMQFVQFNHSYNRQRGTVRGLHLQTGVSAEDKLVKCIRGRVLDVLVDLRRGSGAFLRHECVELSGDNGRAVWVPRGVAHGFQTLEDDTELIYHHTNNYDPERELGLRFDDPALGIEWPLPATTLSDKDAAWPLLPEDFPGLQPGSYELLERGA